MLWSENFGYEILKEILLSHKGSPYWDKKKVAEQEKINYKSKLFGERRPSYVLKVELLGVYYNKWTHKEAKDYFLVLEKKISKESERIQIINRTFPYKYSYIKVIGDKQQWLLYKRRREEWKNEDRSNS